MSGIKYIDVTEFREKGYLQEVNRRALHPVGLALEISVFSRWNAFRYNMERAFKALFKGIGKEIVTGIWDYREDNAGIYYGFSNSRDPNRKLQAMAKQMNFEIEISKRKEEREKLFGNYIEPIESDEKDS